MNQLEIVKSKIAALYKVHPNVHVNIKLKDHKKGEITNLPVVIKALYANMFEVEDRNAKPPKTYVYQYVDVITKEIEILEIANSIPRNEERPSRARHGNHSI
ncbi:MAG: hypothetical protein IJI83_05535 [Oscillospiraceae bacterium]|nr:hypothetical protein [Clostridiales bacterium]MBQ6148989.1 hypothetical protein [Oscillospiraceae bacterium]